MTDLPFVAIAARFDPEADSEAPAHVPRKTHHNQMLYATADPKTE
jgi:hypothetical protein